MATHESLKRLNSLVLITVKHTQHILAKYIRENMVQCFFFFFTLGSSVAHLLLATSVNEICFVTQQSVSSNGHTFWAHFWATACLICHGPWCSTQWSNEIYNDAFSFHRAKFDYGRVAVEINPMIRGKKKKIWCLRTVTKPCESVCVMSNEIKKS